MLDQTQLAVIDTPAPEPGEARKLGIHTYPLDRLILSGLNVRRTERDADIAALAEDIAARGLKQNLVVTPAHFSTGEGTDEGNVDWAYQLEVIAGGRRFQALQLLVADGRLPADHPVPCLLELREDARETSLSENLHRVAMNPADEFEAFAGIVGQHEHAGLPNEEAIALCAKRFGVTAKHVAGRLRLAALAPEILQALREGKVGVEAAKAYAGTADHKLQLKVFAEQAKSHWKPHDPATVRQNLRGDTISLDDPRIKFIGLADYRAAGGRTEVEMFMGSDGEERALDGKLLDQLVKAAAEPLVAPAAKKDGFKEGLFAPGIGYNARWPKAPQGMERHQHWNGEPTKAQLKKSVGVYALASDGRGVTKIGHFRPEQKEQSRGYTPPTPEEPAAQRRERGIASLAARLAVGKFAGSPFEGRAFWPDRNWIHPIDQINDDEVLVAVLVKVTTADIDAQCTAAEAKYDAELAEAEAEKLRQAQAAAEDNDDDVEAVLEDLDAAEGEDDEAAE